MICVLIWNKRENFENVNKIYEYIIILNDSKVKEYILVYELNKIWKIKYLPEGS